MKIEISTRNAIQAATAVLLTVALTYIFHLTRSYWATLTAIFLVAQTFGESIKKSAERIIMTIIGCTVGTFLFALLHTHDWALMSIIAISIFFMSYFFAISYAIAVFFISMLVVFAFGAINNWDTSMLAARILETLIGAAMALLSSALILPISAKTQLKSELPTLVEGCKESFLTAIRKVLLRENTKTKQGVLKGYQSILEKANMVRYENLFTPMNKQNLDRTLFELRMLVYYVGTACDIADNLMQSIDLSLITDNIQQIELILSHNFDLLIQHYQQQHSEETFQSLDETRTELREKFQTQIKTSITEPDHLFKFYSFLYSIRRINNTLQNLINLCQSSY